MLLKSFFFNMTATFSPSFSGIDSSGYTPADTLLANVITTCQVTLANYYDSYMVKNMDGFSSIASAASGFTSREAKGLLTATRQAIYSPSDSDTGVTAKYQYSLFGYDSEERQTESVSSAIIDREYTMTPTEYSRRDHIDRTTTSVVFPDTTYTLYLRNYHDALGNITKSEASQTPGAVGYGVKGQSKIEYDYNALGQMSRMTLFSQASAYNNFGYDMRGRLKSISNCGFSQYIYYEDSTSPCYNGNISAVDFGYEYDPGCGLAWTTDKVTYSYDSLNRLIASNSTDGYSTAYTYNLNSSPLTIERHGMLSDGVSIGLVDDLELKYEGNRLSYISESADKVVLESSSDYWPDGGRSGFVYDSSGRMIMDSGSCIMQIDYAPNDMPIDIDAMSDRMTYSYRADGTKLATAFTPMLDTNDRTTRYDLGVFRFIKDGQNAPLTLERITLPWGDIDGRGNPNILLTDFQGNVRAVYNQYYNSVAQQTDYYPYGLPKAKSTNPEVNRFKYGGKELSTELRNPFYDFSARVQLPTLGLFTRPDPKADKYTFQNPYLYCAGNPIMFIDPTGERLTFNYTNSDGETREYDYVFREDKIIAVDKEGNEVKLQSTSEVKLLNELNELASYNTGKEALSTVIDSDESITIKLANSSDENRFSVGDKTIYFDVDSSEGGFSYDLKTGNLTRERAAYIGLGHEMFHAEDYLKGTLDTSTWFMNSSNNAITNAEKYACKRENQLRREAGIPERLWYGAFRPRNSAHLYPDWNTYILKVSN